MSDKNPELSKDLRRILADRHSPEAAALFRTLLRYVEQRVKQLARGRCRGLLSPSDQEEVMGEVLYQLMEGALARFRGESMGELMAFVRTMTDRHAVRTAERRLRERETVADLRDTADPSWTTTGLPRPDDRVDWEASSPLAPEDREYLKSLLESGSKAELARQQGVSRAAVSQRVARIQARIAKLPRRQQVAHDAWMQQLARDVCVANAGSEVGDSLGSESG